MPTATGHRKLLEQLAADGIATMFGNPGSSEEGLLDELSRFPTIRYILGLQEAALVLIANGYALATQKPTIVQLHCSVGTGNALGSLYHVFRKQRSPLVVIAGEAGVAFDALDAQAQELDGNDEWNCTRSKPLARPTNVRMLQPRRHGYDSSRYFCAGSSVEPSRA